MSYSHTRPSARDIAARLGLKRSGTSWRGQCPACSYPNSFALREGRNGRPLPYCASCQDRNAIADAVARHTGQELPREFASDAAHIATEDRNRDRAIALWNGSEPASGTVADRYLTARGLPNLAASAVLRFRRDTPHPDGGRFRGLIAIVSDVAGTPVGIHRTFLTIEGSKITEQAPRASLGPVRGGAVRLDPFVPGTYLVIGEGIETSASAGRIMGLPAWAGISADNLGTRLVLPPEVGHVIVAADPEDKGRKAADDAWRRWTDEGRKVQIATPKGSGDFNDLWRARGKSNA
jgi:putative DNA primase/helicase